LATEADHIGARTWNAFKGQFIGRPRVIQFTRAIVPPGITSRWRFARIAFPTWPAKLAWQIASDLGFHGADDLALCAPAYA
jgi:hypothetical protein